jgi:hypothetical protein
MMGTMEPTTGAVDQYTDICTLWDWPEGIPQAEETIQHVGQDLDTADVIRPMDVYHTHHQDTQDQDHIHVLT